MSQPESPPSNSAPRRCASLPWIIVFGGDARVQRLEDRAHQVLVFPSPSSSGGRGRRSAAAGLQLGRPCTLVVLCRWVGHSDSGALARHAKAVGARVLLVRGGYAAAQQVIHAELQAA